MSEITNFDKVLKPTFLFAILKSGPILLISATLIYVSDYFAHYAYMVLLASFIPFILFSYNVLFITSKRYTIKNEQLTYKRGVLSITEDYLELYRVKDFKVVRTFFMRIIGVMAVTLETSDKSDPIMRIEGIEKSTIIEDFRNLTELNRRARGVREFD